MATSIDRRQFLLLKPARGRRSIDLSCEWLLMKFLDAEAKGSTSELFARLEHDLGQLDELRLTETSWLTRRDLAQRLEPLVDAFRRRGGRVIGFSPPSA
jgi:hypothetical protein